MNKEEILARCRKENGGADERTQYIGLKGANFSISILVLLWVVLSRFAHLDDTAQYAMGLLVSTTCFSNFAYHFAQKIRTPTVILSSFCSSWRRPSIWSCFSITAWGCSERGGRHG